MRLVSTIILLGLFTANPLMGQKKKIVFENISMDVLGNQVRVNYDLIAPESTKSYDVKLIFVSQNHSVYIPYYISGDVGNNIKPGKQHSITWEIDKDIINLRDRLYPMLVSYSGERRNRYNGGPRNAFLSLLVPGLGDYFVADPLTMRFKPYQRTISAYGLVGLGAYALSQRYRDPDKETLSGGIYGRGDLHYKFFKWDAEFFFLIGGTIWVYDFLWVASKGKVNMKIMNSLERHSLSLNYLPEGAGLSYSFRF